MVTREPLTIRYSNPLGPQSRNISQGRSPLLPKTHVTIKLNRHATRNVLCPQQRSSSAPSRTRTTDYAVECELRCRHALRKGSRARKIQAGAPTIALTRVVADAPCNEHGGRARESRPRRRRLPPTPGVGSQNANVQKQACRREHGRPHRRPSRRNGRDSAQRADARPAPRSLRRNSGARSAPHRPSSESQSARTLQKRTWRAPPRSHRAAGTR